MNIILRITYMLVCLCVAAAAQALTPQQAVDRFAALPAVDADRVAVLISDLSTGKTVASWNESKPLIPASIQKSVTTATLLDLLGKDHRYETKVCVDGRRHGSVVDGNLIVEGSGDPTVNSSKQPESPDIIAEIVKALQKMGVDSIAGGLIVDESVFDGDPIPSSWQSGDLPHAYGTGVHGFNFRNNASGKRSVSDPAAVFSSQLKSALRSAGIRLGGKPMHQGDRKTILTHKSAPLDEIMRSCMMRSDNLYAEALFRTIPVVKNRKSTFASAASMESDFWRKKKAAMSGVEIIDGSGLSRANRTTARFMTDVLSSKSGDPYYASFFPLAGCEGTLKNLLSGTPLQEYVAMKTGSMSGIQCYAGYMLDDDYVPTHTIVVIVNSMRGSRASVRQGVEKMLLSIFAPENEDNPENERNDNE